LNLDSRANDQQPGPASRRRMTPSEIRHATLGRTGLGRRGYHEPEVNHLLNRVADDVEGWMTEHTALRAENETLKAALRDWKRSQRDHAARLAATGSASKTDPVTLLRRVQECVQELQDAGYRDWQLLQAHQRAFEEAELAVHDYRFRAGGRYSAAIEDLERRVAWVRVCFAALDGVPPHVEQADALVGELDGDLEWGPERFA
jgi:DivIVA domain-containing protein